MNKPLLAGAGVTLVALGVAPILLVLAFKKMLTLQ